MPSFLDLLYRVSSKHKSRRESEEQLSRQRYTPSLSGRHSSIYSSSGTSTIDVTYRPSNAYYVSHAQQAYADSHADAYPFARAEPKHQTTCPCFQTQPQRMYGFASAVDLTTAAYSEAGIPTGRSMNVSDYSPAHTQSLRYSLPAPASSHFLTTQACCRGDRRWSRQHEQQRQGHSYVSSQSPTLGFYHNFSTVELPQHRHSTIHFDRVTTRQEVEGEGEEMDSDDESVYEKPENNWDSLFDKEYFRARVASISGGPQHTGSGLGSSKSKSTTTVIGQQQQQQQQLHSNKRSLHRLTSPSVPFLDSFSSSKPVHSIRRVFVSI